MAKIVLRIKRSIEQNPIFLGIVELNLEET